MAEVINSPIDATFILRDYANLAISGKVTADFSVCEAYVIASPLTTAVATVTEIGAGEYRVSFTPTTAETWTCHVLYDAGGVYREFSQSFDVLSKPASVIIVPSDPSGAQLSAMTTQMIARGDSHTWNLPLVDETGNPFDLTGCSVWFTVKQRFNLADADAVVSSSWVDGGASNGITVNDPPSGWISFGITTAQSLDLVASLYVADGRGPPTGGACVR